MNSFSRGGCELHNIDASYWGITTLNILASGHGTSSKLQPRALRTCFPSPSDWIFESSKKGIRLFRIRSNQLAYVLNFHRTTRELHSSPSPVPIISQKEATNIIKIKPRCYTAPWDFQQETFFPTSKLIHNL
ncbi:hypothetical protein ACP275_14G099900 [Erythranthe tilingii]